MQILFQCIDAKGGHKNEDNWYSSNASVEEIVKVLKQYPSYKTSILRIQFHKKIYLNNPIEVDGSNELFERLYEIAELPNRILSGYTYRQIFHLLKIKSQEGAFWWNYMKTILAI